MAAVVMHASDRQALRRAINVPCEIVREQDFKLLAKNPEERYSSAAQLIEDLRALEMGRPLRQAADGGEGVPHSTNEEEIPEIDLDRVIEGSATDPGGRMAALPSHTSLQLKAILAMVAISGFALVIILSTALLRQTPGDPAAAPGTQQAKAAAPAPAPAELTVRLAHNLKAGRLSIMMDGQPLMVEPFRGERSRMRMQGTLSHRREVPEGEHLFSVTVEEEGGRRWTAATTRDLAEGSDATLFVEVKGILKKKLDLTWY
jgi:hypothetical protein